MTRLRDLEADPAFQQAIKGVQSAGKIITGEEFEERNARLIATFALTAFVNAGGLSEPSISIVARFAPDIGMGDGPEGTP